MSGVDEALRTFRRDAGLTQEQLAERSGLSVEAIRALEIGRRRQPRAATLGRLAGALGLDRAGRDLLEAAARGPTQDTLPAGPPGLVGRAEEVRRLHERLTGSPGSTAVVAIAGMGGIGKTALALHVAHRADFPDGRLYLNLRGATEPVRPLDALGTLLRSLGVPPGEVPGDLDAAAGRYRTVVAGRRLLLVLDDAADADQVAPLIPGSPGSAALVTSRRLLDRLPGAEHVRLDVLSDADGVSLLAHVTGRDGAEPAAALDVVRRCGNLPLAIGIAGTRAGRAPLRSLADRLADESTRLAELADGETGVRASIALSLADLAGSPEAAAFPVLSLLDAGGFPVRAAAAALGRPLGETEEVLDRLVDVHLLDAPALHRYRLHDLVRAVGRERVDPAVGRDVACRVRACYLAMLWRADELDGGGSLSTGWKDPAWAAPARDLDDLDEVLDWLDVERATLLRLVRHAPAEFVVRAAVGMNAVAPARKRWLEWREVNLAAAGLVDPTADPVGAAMVHFDLGLAYGELGDFPAAAGHLASAVSAARVIDARDFLVSGLIDLAHMLERSGRPREGFGHVAEALELAAGDAHHTMWATLTLGMLHGRAGALAEQADALTRAVAMAREAPPRIAARVLSAAGTSYRESGQAEAAIPVLAECAALCREHDPSGGEAEALDELATALRQLGRPAVGLYLDALRVAREHDLWDREASIRTGLARAYTDLGRDGDAGEQRALAERILTAHGMPVPADVRPDPHPGPAADRQSS